MYVYTNRCGSSANEFLGVYLYVVYSVSIKTMLKQRRQAQFQLVFTLHWCYNDDF